VWVCVCVVCVVSVWCVGGCVCGVCVGGCVYVCVCLCVVWVAALATT